MLDWESEECKWFNSTSKWLEELICRDEFRRRRREGGFKRSGLLSLLFTSVQWKYDICRGWTAGWDVILDWTAEKESCVFRILLFVFDFLRWLYQTADASLSVWLGLSGVGLLIRVMQVFIINASVISHTHTHTHGRSPPTIRSSHVPLACDPDEQTATLECVVAEFPSAQ